MSFTPPETRAERIARVASEICGCLCALALLSGLVILLLSCQEPRTQWINRNQVTKTS